MNALMLIKSLWALGNGGEVYAEVKRETGTEYWRVEHAMNMCEKGAPGIVRKVALICEKTEDEIKREEQEALHQAQLQATQTDRTGKQSADGASPKAHTRRRFL